MHAKKMAFAGIRKAKVVVAIFMCVSLCACASRYYPINSPPNLSSPNEHH